MNVSLRFATGEDRSAVYRLRYEFYVEKQGLYRDQADHDRRRLTDPDDVDSRILLAEVGGDMVGTVRLTWGTDAPFSADMRQTYELERFHGTVDERDIMVATRLLVHGQRHGGMLSFQLLWKAFEFAAIHGVELLLSHCQPGQTERYARFGFRPYGRVCEHPVNGPMIPLAVVTGDVEYLQQVGSPLLPSWRLRTKPTRDLDRIVSLVTEDVADAGEGGPDHEDSVSEIIPWLDEAGGGVRGIFGDLTQEEAFVLLAKSQVVAGKAGDRLIARGDTSRTLYVLLSGSLQVLDDGAVVAVVERPGSVVGEVAFFTEEPRMSDVVAGPGGAQVLALSEPVLREIIAGYGATAAKFLNFVARGLCGKLKERAGLASKPGGALH